MKDPENPRNQLQNALDECSRLREENTRLKSLLGHPAHKPSGPATREQSGNVNKRIFFPVTNDVIRDHLLGRHTVGIYPLLLDETCYFLAADFDKKSWQEDAGAFLVTCREFGVPVALRKRGPHLDFFLPRDSGSSRAKTRLPSSNSDYGATTPAGFI